MNLTPEQIVDAMRKNIKDAQVQFTHGRCYQLYAMLKELFPNARAWYDGNHVYTEIYGAFYDINGKHFVIPDGSYLLSLEPAIEKDASNWDYIPDMQRGLN